TCLPATPPFSNYTTASPSIWTISPPGAGTINGNPNGVAAVNVTWNQPGPAQVCAVSVTCPNAPLFCLDVNVGEDVSSVENVTTCQGQPVQCAGQNFVTAGTYPVTLPSYINCDSVVNCVVSVIPTVYSTEDAYMCQGQSVECAGQEFFGAGNFPVTLQAWQGCDSIVTCRVHIIQVPINPMQLITICGPTTYEVCGVPYTESGLVSEICPNYQGCDSLVNVNLAILDPIAVIAQPDTIDCSSNPTVTLNGAGSNINTAIGGITLYQWSGPGIVGSAIQPTCVVNQPGQYCLVLSHGRAGLYCRDTVCVTVPAISALPQVPAVDGTLTPCFDSTIIYTATSIGNPAPTSFTWTTPNGVPFTTISTDSIQITWSSPVDSGLLCVTANNSCGPSQPACLPITVLQPLLTPQLSGPADVCTNGGTYTYVLDTTQSGTSYTWSVPAGAVLTGSGDTIQVDFQNAVSGQVCVLAENSCATGLPVCQAVTVNTAPTANLTDNAEICNGETVTLTFSMTGNGPFDVVWNDGMQNVTLTDITNGHTEQVNPTTTTQYHLIGVSDNSATVCSNPATDTVTVTVWQHVSMNQTAQICDGESILLGGALQTVSGIFVDSLNTIHGCDSIINTTLTVYTIDSLSLFLTTCDPAMAGTTVQMLAQTNGCDSIVTTTVTLLPSDTTYLTGKSCDINNVGVFTNVLGNQYGCDSTVITTINFSFSDTTYLSGSSCDFNQTGVFTQNLTNLEGCDSLVITTVAFLQSDTTLLFGMDCNPANVGVFTNVLNNQNGCDSTIITTIAFFHTDTTFLASTSCDPMLAGVFTQILPTPAGCDSVIVTTVALLPSDTTLLFGTDCNPANVGVFTNILSNQYGCDSTVVTTIDFVQTDSTFLTDANCDPALTGVFAQTLVTPSGCDSVVITTVSLLPTDTTYLFAMDCDTANVGVFTQLLSNQYGCDSLVVTTVDLLPSDETAVLSFTCDPAVAGLYTYNLLNQFGCDSIVMETFLLLPSDTTYLAFDTCDPNQTGTVTTILPNQYGCDSTIIAVTTLLPADNCSVNATLSGSIIPCGVTTGTLTLTPTLGIAPFNYSVLLAGVPVATGSVAAVGTPEIISGLAPGNYTVTVNSPNGYSATVQAVVTQLFPPTLVATVTSNFNGFAVSCTGEMDGSAQVSVAGGLSPYLYAWSNAAVTPDIANIGLGTYSVTVTDANNCTAMASVSLNQPTPLNFNFTVNDLDCFGQNDGAIFVNASGGVAPYRYSIDGSDPQTSNGFTGLSSGAYSIMATDANDCQRTEVIVVNASIPVNVDLGDDQTIELGNSTTIQALVNVPLDSILSVVWTPPFDTSECPTCLTQVVTPFVSTTYSIQVEGVNGCSDEDKMTVIVDRRRYVYAPNAFSPDNDGFNDLFQLFAREGTVAKFTNFQVFDRWGELMYTVDEFLPNDPNVGWDGKLRGEPLVPGVFIWYVEVEFIDGVKELYTRDVTLTK
ncbi:MAG: gliding motility-associated C-terminal domain-containing protein, partial [Lewinellaceae bacterium]|nr:gliding motility-associated C-terminal domain-containing protein [Lewinellaceae bacterium]